METIIAGLMPSMLTAAGTVLTTLVSFALAKARAYLATRTKNELVNNALTRISHTTATVVGALTQTMAQSLKDKAADGKLTKEEASLLASEALTTVKNQLPGAIKKHALLGVTDLDAFIKAKIEAAVLAQKGAVIRPEAQTTGPEA